MTIMLMEDEHHLYPAKIVKGETIMANMKTIKIYGRKVELQNGLAFVKYTFTKDGNKFYRIAFKKTAKGYPTYETGYLLVTFDQDLVGAAKKGKEKVTKNGHTIKENDTIYLDGMITYVIDTASNNAKAQAHNEEIDSLFE